MAYMSEGMDYADVIGYHNLRWYLGTAVEEGSIVVGSSIFEDLETLGPVLVVWLAIAASV